jgi:hypothetical protein
VNEERELRDRLGTVDVPASRVGLDGLLRDGRRRVVRRRSLRAAAGAVLAVGVLVTVPSVLARPSSGRTVGAAPSAAGKGTVGEEPDPVSCKLNMLPTPAGMKEVNATDVDPSGRYVIGNGSSGQDFRPVMWTDGKARALPQLEKSVQLTGVNSSGVVVGLASQGKEEYAFRYANGQYTRLYPPAGNWHIYPEPEINAAGDIVMNVEPVGNSGGKDSFGIIWRDGATKAVRLPLPAGANVHDINDDGLLIGSVYKDGSAQAGYVWDQQGKGHRLDVPPGQTTAAYAVRGDWATGGVWPAEKPARWNIRTGKVAVLETPKGADLSPALAGLGPGEAVNNLGWVVALGMVVGADGPIVPAVPKGKAARAAAVSDTGLVVGLVAPAGKDRDADQIAPATWQC